MKALGFDVPKAELVAILTTYGVPANTPPSSTSAAGPPTTTTNAAAAQQQHQQQQQQQHAQQQHHHHQQGQQHQQASLPPTRLHITLETFQALMAARILARDPRDEILRAFALFDAAGSGVIRVDDLRRVARELGEGLDDDELAAMIDEFDLDGDGGINRDEFMAICLQ